MYPFGSRTRWLLAGRTGHLLAVAATAPTWNQELLADRCRRLRVWGIGRAIASVLLSAGVLTTVVLVTSTLAFAFGGIARWGAAWASSAAGVLSLVFLVTNHVVGALESDVLGLLAGPPHQRELIKV